jgi:hypothetical protein
MRYQQNPAGRKIAVVVFGQQQWPHVRPYIQRVVDAVNAAKPGSYAEVDVPYEQRSGPTREAILLRSISDGLIPLPGDIFFHLPTAYMGLARSNS